MPLHHLTDVVQPDPVCSIHFLLYVPGYDEVLATVQRVLQSGRCQRGPALGCHQVSVAVCPRKPDGAAHHGHGIYSRPAPLRQSPQVLRAEGVPEMWAAPSWGRQVFAAPNGQVGWIVGTGPGWQDRCGEGRTHVGNK